MPTTDTNVWDYVVTYGGPSLFMTAVFLFVMPLVWFKFARPRFERWPSRLAVMLAVWLLAWLVAYGDVLMIAHEAKRMCETEAGLKVYRTVEVEGFAGVIDIDYWAKKGFRFLEYVDRDGTIYHIEKGKRPVRLQSRNKMQSEVEYEYLGWTTHSQQSKFAPHKYVIRDLNSKEILGELINFQMQYGWLDRPITGASGAHKLFCEGTTPVGSDKLSLNYQVLIDAVIKPK